MASNDPLMAFNWPLMALSWPSDGPLWSSDGPLMALSWPSHGPLMALSWPSGPLMGRPHSELARCAQFLTATSTFFSNVTAPAKIVPKASTQAETIQIENCWKGMLRASACI